MTVKKKEMKLFVKLSLQTQIPFLFTWKEYKAFDIEDVFQYEFKDMNYKKCMKFIIIYITYVRTKRKDADYKTFLRLWNKIKISREMDYQTREFISTILVLIRINKDISILRKKKSFHIYESIQ